MFIATGQDVATHGGGTGLATPRKVNRLAEIVAAVALAGEISLAVASSASDWVSSYEKQARNR